MARIIYCGDELYHWGILGQKHGIRRFQYPDGTLTPEGRIRYRKDGTKRPRSERRALQKEYDAQMKARVKEEAAEILAEQKRKKEEALAEEKHVKDLNKKKINEMTDEELREYTNRKKAEKDAYEAQKNILDVYAKLHPEKESAAKKFVDLALDKVVYPSAQKGMDKVFQALANRVQKAQVDESKIASEKLKQQAQDMKNKMNYQLDKNSYDKAVIKAKEIKEEMERVFGNNTDNKNTENKKENKKGG